jgi:uncharacterized membrane protein YecN with MAPEG domain
VLITPAYAAIFALLFVALSLRTIRLRRRVRVGIGSGGDASLERAARVHANFAEYVPLALVLIYFMEIETAGNAWVHGLCAALLAGRLLHAYGVSQVRENYRFRTAGMALTFIVILSAALRLLYAYVSAFGASMH